MIITDAHINMFAYCEVNYYKYALQETVSRNTALKQSDKVLKYLDSVAAPKDLGAISLYDPYTEIGFGFHNVIKIPSKRAEKGFKLLTQSTVNGSKLYGTDAALAKLKLGFLLRNNYDIKEHSFINYKEGYVVDVWDAFNEANFSLEARSLAFWIHGLMRKQFKPYVPERVCANCSVRTKCKKYMRYSQLDIDTLTTEEV